MINQFKSLGQRIRSRFTVGPQRRVRKQDKRYLPQVDILETRNLLAALPAVGDVFYIDLENHNFTQPNGNVNTNSATIQQLFGNPAAPYLNSLVTPGNPNAAMVSYATNYHNVLATQSGNNPSIHPSEPNYIWQEGGSNYGVLGNDADPYANNGNPDPNLSTNVKLIAATGNNPANLSALLQAKYGTAGWKAYQEDMEYTGLSVPTVGVSGANGATNSYNGSTLYDFAPKHDGTLFYTATNGGTLNGPGPSDATNTEAAFYAPLGQLATDLASNTVAKYNLITPDQYNDMHTSLPGGFTYNGVHYTGDASNIAQGDNFLSKLIPMIEASAAFKNNGAIVIWNDESEPQDASDTTPNDFNHNLTEIVISPLAKGNAFASTMNYTHSSDVKTLEEIFGVTAPGGGFLGDANTAGTNDLSDLFKSPTAGITEFPIPTANSSPFNITTGPDGNLWFTENGANQIGRIALAGNITEFPVLTAASGPFGITAGPDGNLWFTEFNGNKIGRITPAGVVTEFPISTANSQPDIITKGPDGNLWFTEFSGNKIGQITPAGVVTEFSIPTASSQPTDITLGPDGNLWFAEFGGGKIGRITPAGAITEFPITTANSQPTGITRGPDGNLWFSEFGANNIGRITPTGTITEFPIPTANSQPQHLTAGPDGNVWFAEQGSNQIGRITPSGTITEFPIPTANSGPIGITLGSDGNLWFTESAANQIGRLTPGLPNAGFDELGAYRPSDGSWSLDSNGQFGFQSGPVAGPSPLADRVITGFSPASATLIPVSGDWTGLGTSEIGDFNNGTWHLDLNNNGIFDSGETFQFGQAGDVPVPGDYLNVGQLCLAVWRPFPTQGYGEFFISDQNWLAEAQAGKSIGIASSFIFGAAGDHVVVGDWNGKGLTEVGVYRDAVTYIAADAGDAVFTLDVANHHTFDGSNSVFVFGKITDQVVIGDWDGSGTSKVGVYRPATAFGAPNTAVFSLDLHGALDFTKDGQVFLFGAATDKYVTGRWAYTTSTASATIPAITGSLLQDPTAASSGST